MKTVKVELLVEDAEEEVGPKVQARACARTDALRVGEQHQHHESRARAKAAAADADVKVLSRLAHESLQLAAAHALELASSASSWVRIVRHAVQSAERGDFGDQILILYFLFSIFDT